MPLKYQKAQVAIEYLLLFSVVVLIILAAVGPGGFISQNVKTSLDASFDATRHVAIDTSFNVYAESGTCVCRAVDLAGHCLDWGRPDCP